MNQLNRACPACGPIAPTNTAPRCAACGRAHVPIDYRERLSDIVRARFPRHNAGILARLRS